MNTVEMREDSVAIQRVSVIDLRMLQYRVGDRVAIVALELATAARTLQFVTHDWPPRCATVGTNPALGSATTRVPVRIAPRRLTFSDGVTLDGTDSVNEVVRSPMFRIAEYRSGKTQYGNAMQRASFWKYVATTSPRYHMLLDEPKILPTLQIDVPANGGSSYQTPSGPAGVVQLPFLVTLLPRLDDLYDPASLLILLGPFARVDGPLTVNVQSHGPYPAPLTGTVSAPCLTGIVFVRERRLYQLIRSGRGKFLGSERDAP
jgi:hypothetical protein